MDFFIKDEPLDLDFNLQEEFINEVPKGNNVIGEITALVKKAQIFLQESAYDMKNMHDCFDKMKKRHAENTRITFRVLQLLTTFNVSPASIDNDTYVNLQLENIDNERPPENTSMDHVYHELQSDEIDIMEFSQLEKDLNYTRKEDADEIPNSIQKESEYNSLPNRNQDAKHSSSGETQSFQLEDDDESEILYVDVLSVDSKTDDCTNETSYNAQSSNPQGNKNSKRELLTCDVCKKRVKYLSRHLKIHGLFPDEIKQICREKKQRKPLKSKIGPRCPFPQCSKVSSYVRLDKHLLHFHKLKTSHPLYRQFIKTNTLPNKITKSKTMSKLIPGVAAESGKSTDTGRTPEQVESTEIEYSTIASEEFFDFLISINGGSVKIQNANNYRSKIRQILEGSDIKKVEEFESEEVVLKLCNWFDSYLETHEKSSTKSYMSVLIKFLYYLGIKNPWKNYKYNSVIEDVKDRMHSWSTRISEKIPVHDITPLEIRAFDISDIGRKCKSNLEMVKSGIITTVSNIEHCQIRNYLVLSAILRNGWKSCALGKMTLQELKEPKKELRNGTVHYNIYIKDHKSRKEPGPMRVTLGEELYNHYLCYVEKIRPLVVLVDNNIQTVFITLNGYSINTDYMCDGILAMWKEAGLKTYITTTVLKNLIINRIDSREDGKINEDLAQQSINSHENRELSQSVAPSDMYRMLSDENISDFSSSLENDTHTQLECNSGTSSIKIIPQFNKHQPDLSSLPSKSNLTHDHPPNKNFQAGDITCEISDITGGKISESSNNCGSMHKISKEPQETFLSDATCNSELEDSVGTATLGFDNAVTKNKMATCQDKKDSSYAKSNNIVTMRKREVGRERLCKNCPICPKKLKVNSNCSVANICSQSNRNTENVSDGKSCPLKGCEEKGKFKRLDYHLKRKHNLSTDSLTYQTLCSVREGDGLQKGLKKMKGSPASSKEISSEISQNMSDDTCSKISRANIESSSVDSTFREAGSPIISQPISKPTSPASSTKNISSNISQNIPEDESSELSWVNMENLSVEARPSIEVSDLIGKGRKTFNLDERDLIIKTFQEFIDKNCLPSIPIIRQYMNEKGPLNSIVKEKNFQPSQIKGCLLNIINKRKQDEFLFRYNLQ